MVALDQRRPHGTVPPTWRGALQIVRNLTEGGTVKLFVSPPNRELFDALLEEFIGSGGFSKHSLEYAPHRSPSDLRHVIKGAQVVITDLCAVEIRAKDAGAEVVRVQDDVRYSVLKPSNGTDSLLPNMPEGFAVGTMANRRRLRGMD